MACSCRLRKQSHVQDFGKLPIEPCLFCAQKHFSQAWVLASQSGYQGINRNHIIGLLACAQWHLYKKNLVLADQVRYIRHMVQQRKQAQLQSEWRNVAKALDELIQKQLKLTP